MKPDRPPIDAQRFDELVAVSKPEHLWGAQAIAAVAGVCEDTARRSWSKRPGVPIHRRGGRYFAVRTELMAWLRGAKAPEFPDIS